LTVGCASTSDVQKAQSDASEAKAMARNALDTANEAQTHTKATQGKKKKIFKKKNNKKNKRFLFFEKTIFLYFSS
ncbi:MAG TPA: hypothetical protein DIC59_10450, partial [Candidatus Competibacteraceae bacterium]|nr:hypothetical protein [Candidatus Competibacteraceae bacterium]